MKLLFYPFIRWALGLPWSKFLDLVSAVRSASSMFPKTATMSLEQRAETNAARAAFVRKWADGHFPAAESGWLLNLAIEAAVGWLELTEK